MSPKILWKGILIVLVFVLFGYFLYPTIQFNSMSLEQRKTMEREDPAGYRELAKKSIKLGLDLQGGMRLVLEVDTKELLNKLAQNKDSRFTAALDAAATAAAESDKNLVDQLDARIREAGGNIGLYFSTREVRERDEIITYLKQQVDESIDRSLEVLRNRVDEFGVSEPIIQKQGDNRIIVELAGVTDRQQAINLVGKTAKLEFSIVKDLDVAQRTAAKINEYLLGQAAANDTTSGEAVAEEVKDSTTVSAEELFGANTDSASADSGEAVSSENDPLFLLYAGGIAIRQQDILRFEQALKDPKVQQIIQRESQNGRFLLETVSDSRLRTGDENDILQTYLVNNTAALTGETIIDAKSEPAPMDDAANFGRYQASITFNKEGTRAFAAVTGANEGKRMAIILDDKVRSAPNIQEKIRQGRARITGLDSNDEARVLSSVLKAGSLPTPLDIIEERTVGPSLGKDSIEKGTLSTVLGLVLVAFFMIIYYKFSGVVANVALILNVFILLGFMSSLHATLTLPGIAGIILTIGMAVDANVLIFERIREELDGGKSTWAALDTGYGRAFVTILDANITTFIAAVVLYNFGTGPVRGFATTLMIGIGASMFTAIFVTRTIFDFLLSKRIIKEISI
ncbi:MAG: protein translocase subunit SecD [Calditrichia bacterium]